MMSAHALIVEPFETLAFMRGALIACLALALANGALGTLLVLRRMSLDGDVLGHAVMPGAAVGFLYAGPSPAWLFLGGLASGFAVAALARLITSEPARRDAGLVAFYLVALSLGVLLVAWRGSNVDVMRVLFGTVLAIDQRALCARVILQDAMIILLDEPFAAVDAPSVPVLLDQVTRWHQEGRTVIAVLHDLELVQAHFPSTLVLARRCLAWGKTEEALPALAA